MTREARQEKASKVINNDQDLMSLYKQVETLRGNYCRNDHLVSLPAQLAVKSFSGRPKKYRPFWERCKVIDLGRWAAKSIIPV